MAATPQLMTIMMLIFIVDSQFCTTQSNVSLPIPMFGHQSAYDSASNTVYFFGGWSAKYPEDNINSIYKWNVNKNIWTELTSITPTSIFYSWVNSAVTINNIVYFIGMNDYAWGTGEVYLFDINSAQWLDNSHINSPIYPSVDACVVQNITHILAVGGVTTFTKLNQLQIYSISNNMWSYETINVEPIKTDGWYKGYCQYIGAALYTFGGRTAAHSAIDNIFKYTTSEKWKSIGNLPFTQVNGLSVYHERDNVIYVVGSYDNNVDVFDVSTESITATWNMSQNKLAPAAQLIQDTLYIFGGELNNTLATSTIETCTNPTAHPTKAITTLSTLDEPETTELSIITATDTYSTTSDETEITELDIIATSNEPSVRPSNEPSVSPSNEPSVRLHDARVRENVNTTNDENDDETDNPQNTIKRASNLYLYIRIASAFVSIIIVLSVIYCVCLCYKKRKKTNKDEQTMIERGEKKDALSNANIVELETVNAVTICAYNGEEEVDADCDDSMYENDENNIDDRTPAGDRDRDEATVANDSGEEQTDSDSDHESMYDNQQNKPVFDTNHTRGE